MIPLSSKSSFEAVRNIAIPNPFTRYPVYEEGMDTNIRVFRSKYLLSWSTAQDKS
jgi:putative hemolysin